MKGAPVNMLFITGPGRSGTTAFADYLNQHPEVMVCRERYKWIRSQITPGLFTSGNIMNYAEGETNTPRDFHARLLSSKNPKKLRWIGDKAPRYVEALHTISENNPGARFIVLYRPLEEVVESYEARSRNPGDRWLGGRDGFNIGINDWNSAMRRTREFAESEEARVLLVNYRDFFERHESFVPLLSRFLDLEFDEDVLKAWKKNTSKFEDRRRQKEPYGEDKRQLLQQQKDHASEDWVLGRIEEQWRDLDSPEPERATSLPEEAYEGWRELAEELGRMDMKAQAHRNRQLERRIEELEKDLRNGKPLPMRARLLEELDRIKKYRIVRKR